MNRKVLIIDDETDLCLMIFRFLTKKNYDVICAYNLTEGKQQLYEFKPDSLLLDNNLPDGLGWENAENFHKDFPAMHITLISANTMIPYAGPGQAFDRIEKPISIHTLEQYL
jgi:two-component system OmpR family response regulator